MVAAGGVGGGLLGFFRGLCNKRGGGALQVKLKLMEATHFIEVYKYKDGTPIEYSNFVHDISQLDFCLQATLSESEYLETIAVWRIKQTDVPIERRLAERLGSPNGFSSQGFYQKANEMYANTKL